jgi:glycosyltransferase involved in cell wall biosynthesis
MLWGYSSTTPFFEDYLASQFLGDCDYDLAVSYGCPFGLTVEKLKKNSFCKVVADLAPHNISISMDEFKRNNMQYSFPHLINPFLKELYLKHLRLADRVIVHSRSSAEYIQKEANLKELPDVIPHGCYPPEKTEKLPDEFTCGYAGALGTDKGIVYLINSIINYPDRITLLIGGREAQNFMVNQKYADRFKVVGEFADMKDFYNQCSIGIYPSIVEGFGICILETMAHGRPVIVGEGAGASELIEDGKQGFVVDGRDVQGIINKIKYFEENPDEVRRMGSEARKTAEKYTWESIRAKYVDLYKKLLNQ